MADRRVYLFRKDGRNRITALCNPGEDWSPRKTKDAIRDIETNTHRYYVTRAGIGQMDVRVVVGPGGKYLLTDQDDIPRNGQDDLPVC